MEIKQVKSGGRLRISNEVVEKIAEIAATEIPGVLTNGQKLLSQDTARAVAGRFYRPVSVKLSSEAIEININITVIQGFKALNVAEAVQGNVKSTIQNMTGIAVSKVNVMIIGILIVNTDG